MGMLPTFGGISFGGPTYTADFSSSVPADWTFTRASNGTYIDSAGILQTASSNVARFPFDGNGVAKGLLVENDATNLLLYSADFTNNVSWVKTGGAITNPTATNITGAANTNLFTEDTSTGVHSIYQSVVKAASNIFYSQSIYIKPNGRNRVLFRMEGTGGTNGIGADITLTGDGTVNSAAAFGSGFSNPVGRVEKLYNGWWRIYVGGTTNTDLVVTFVIYGLDSGGNSSYTGDGASGFYLYGAQLETSSFNMPTSYILTTTGSATRAREVVTTTPTWYVTNSNGSLYIEYYPNVFNPGTTGFLFQIDDNSNNNRHAFRVDTSNYQNYTQITGGSTIFLTTNTSANAINRMNYSACSWADNNAAIVVNFQNSGIDLTGTKLAAALTNARLASTTNLSRANGCIRKVAYWSYKIPNQQLGFAL